MTPIAVKPRRKAPKISAAAKPYQAYKDKAITYRTFATHQELLDDMAEFGRKLAASPDAARAFLVKAGLITKDGKPRQLIRD